MSDGTPINPTPPPWEPTDVDVVFDDPPWPPVDVPIYPDGPPWDPIEVPLFPSAPPWEAFQVATYPDDPPWDPFDVPIYPDGPPWDPEDVPVQLSPGPWPPVDVPTVPDGPPWDATDVATTPSDPPWAPVDVAVTPSGPPATPVDVPVALDDPPRPPRRVHHDVPPPWEPKQRITTPELVDSLRRYDHQLANFLDRVGEFVPFVSAAGKGAFDPLVLADWLRNYKDAVGPTGMAKFVAEQTALYAMNPVVARFFDPTYFAKLGIPGATGMFNTHVDIDSYADVVLSNEEALQRFVGVEPPIGHRTNVYDAENRYDERQDFSVDEMVDARTQDPPRVVRYTKASPDVPGVARFDASKYFESRDTFGGQRIRGETKNRVRGGDGPDVGTSKLAKSAATHGIIRVGVPGDGEPIPNGSVGYNGAVLSPTTSPSVDDDDVRLPLYFTDLRKDPSSDAYRSVFFQPMNLVINESYAPSYNETQAFGRVDPAVGYIGTARSWSVSFEVHAFAPEDLRTMYEKMTWLTSMVYPTYGPDALMRSGPVCRMRIGDLAATTEGGVPGVIRSLSFDFAECLWELQRGMKVPRSYSVQLDYLVLHDGPVGLLDGLFGVLALPGATSTTNLAGGAPKPDQQSTENASLSQGRWSRFGTPSRKG